jgi:putative DNA primase/helicase
VNSDPGEFTPIGETIGPVLKENLTNPVKDFMAAIESAGLTPPSVIHDDGRLHRFASNGDHDDDAGWYVLFSDGIPAGAFGCWRSGSKQNWCAKSDRQMSESERAEYRRNLEMVKRQREAEERRQHQHAAERARGLWGHAEPAPTDHPYLERKGVRSHGLRVDGDTRLLVPVLIEDRMTGLQFIFPDGSKTFLRGSEVKGSRFVLGETSGASEMLICEGYATGASLYEATGISTVISFNAGNLLAVAQTLRQQYPYSTIVCCADDDAQTPGNPGLTKAREAAQAVNGGVAIPDFGISQPKSATDFNDLHRLRGLESVRTQVKIVIARMSGMSGSDSDGWPDPMPIRADLLPVEPLPLQLIPSPFRAWVKDVSDRMQCPPDYVAAGLVVMAGAVIGAGCGIRPKKNDDWTVVPSFWGGVVGRPSMLKTPAIGEAMKPLEALEGRAKQEYDAAIKNHRAEIEAFKANRDALQGDMRKAAKAKDQTTSLIGNLKQRFAELEEPKHPVWRRYKTNDATIEKMGELQADNPRGILLFRDELIGLFATWDKENHESDRAFYLEAWNGIRPYTSDRIGRGTVYVENLCVSLFGGIQPTKLIGYLHAAMRGHNNDGMVQRLQVLVYPDEPRWTLSDKPINLSAKREAYRVVERLAHMDFTQVGGTVESDCRIPYFRFEEEAQDVFYEWLTELETKLRNETEEPVVLEHLGKYRSLMPALALTFHLLELANQPTVTSGQVSKASAHQAAAWVDYLETHARRVYGMVTNLTAQAASRLATKLTKGSLPVSFSVRDVYRKEWGLLDDRQVIENACEELVTLGWLREKVTPPASGQRGKTEYVTNPKVRNHG